MDSHALLFTSIVATSTCIMIHKHLTIYNGFFGHNLKPCEVVLVVSVRSALVKSLSEDWTQIYRAHCLKHPKNIV